MSEQETFKWSFERRFAAIKQASKIISDVTQSTISPDTRMNLVREQLTEIERMVEGLRDEVRRELASIEDKKKVLTEEVIAAMETLTDAFRSEDW